MKMQSFKRAHHDANNRVNIKIASKQSIKEKTPHAGFLSPSFLILETNVLGLIFSNSAAPPGP